MTIDGSGQWAAGPGGDILSTTTPVKRVTAPLRGQVIELLRREITEMRLRPGQRLIERELIEQIGVSRTTVREALRELAAEGLVTTIPQKGVIVAVPSPREAAELYEVRALLEGLLAAHFVERASASQMKALRRAFEAVERSQGAGPRAMLLDANRFYDVLAEGSGDTIVTSILDSLRTRVTALRATTLAAPGRAQRSAEELSVILGAIEARDADGAREACVNHVRQAAACLAEVVPVRV